MMFELVNGANLDLKVLCEVYIGSTCENRDG